MKNGCSSRWQRSGVLRRRALGVSVDGFDLGVDGIGLDVGLVSVGVAADNEKSRRAVEKYVDDAGGRFEGVVRRGLPLTEGDVRDEARYSVSQAEWRDAGGADDAVAFLESL